MRGVQAKVHLLARKAAEGLQVLEGEKELGWLQSLSSVGQDPFHLPLFPVPGPVPGKGQGEGLACLYSQETSK